MAFRKRIGRRRSKRSFRKGFGERRQNFNEGSPMRGGIRL